MLLHYTDTGSGKPVVLLHGMAGSARYWNNFIPYISEGHRIIALDLLGFGRSPKPTHMTYTYDTHIDSILETLTFLKVSKPFSLVGHSMGSLIALRMAAWYPDTINQLLLIAMPIYTTPKQAHQAITGSSKLKEWAYYGPSSKILCTVWCRLLRPLSRRLAPTYLPHLTKEAAEDSVLHTWQAYAESLHNILEHQAVMRDLAFYKKPATFVYGDKDVPDAWQKMTIELESTNHAITVFKGTHQIINEQPKQIAALL